MALPLHAVSAGPTPSADPVLTAIREAASATGTDFGYLLKTAMRESSLNPEALAKTSSAAGLFQFIEQTWLGLVDRHGAKYGLAQEAATVDRTASGRFTVADAGERERILALRHDPAVSAALAGEMTRESADALERHIGRRPSEGELYMAHFLGLGGARALIEAAEARPADDAADLFPAAAKANRPIFYGEGGQARTVGEVYRKLAKLPDAGDPMAKLAESAPASAQAVVAPKEEEAAFPPAGAPSRSAAAGSWYGGPAPLRLTAAIVEILASLDPIPDGKDAGKPAKAPRPATPFPSA